MHREGHHLNLSVQGNFGSGISGGFTVSNPISNPVSNTVSRSKSAQISVQRCQLDSSCEKRVATKNTEIVIAGVSCVSSATDETRMSAAKKSKKRNKIVLLDSSGRFRGVLFVILDSSDRCRGVLENVWLQNPEGNFQGILKK